MKAGLLTTPKLLIPELSAKAEPILDSGQYYPSHSFYYLSSRTWDLTVLGGLLLSDLVNIFISSKGVKMRGQTLRFQAQYQRMIRFPDFYKLSKETKAILSKAFCTRDRELANIGASQAYSLSDHEKEVLKI